jgi:hypothetical protein
VTEKPEKINRHPKRRISCLMLTLILTTLIALVIGIVCFFGANSRESVFSPLG